MTAGMIHLGRRLKIAVAPADANVSRPESRRTSNSS